MSPDFPVLTPYEQSVFERFFVHRHTPGYHFPSVQLEGNKRLPVVAAGHRLEKKGLVVCHCSCQWFLSDLGKSLAQGWRTFVMAGSAYTPMQWKKIEAGTAKILTHAVLNATNLPACKKVKRDHLLDDTFHITCEMPTCPACLRALKLKPV